MNIQYGVCRDLKKSAKGSGRFGSDYNHYFFILDVDVKNQTFKVLEKIPAYTKTGCYTEKVKTLIEKYELTNDVSKMLYCGEYGTILEGFYNYLYETKYGKPKLDFSAKVMLDIEKRNEK